LRGSVRGFLDNGRVEFKLGRTRDDPDLPLATSMLLNVDATVGSQLLRELLLGRHSTLGGHLSFSTQNAIRNTSSGLDRFNRLNDITTRQINSNFDYTTSWDWG